MVSCCVVGSLNMDLVAQCGRMPGAGETVEGCAFDVFPGGKGANQAVAAARLGMKMSMVGCVGEDSFGVQALRNLRQNKVSVRGITRLPDVPTGVASVTLCGGDNRIIVAGGANRRFGVELVKKQEAFLRDSKLILLQNEIPFEVNEQVMKTCHGRAKLLFNAAPAMRIERALYPLIDILIVNEHECGMMLDTCIADADDAQEAVRRFGELGCKSAVVTLGAQGAVFYENGQTGRVDGFRVQAADTTGAGDTFCGALAVAVAEGKSLSQAVAFANSAAALSVLKKGAQTSMPYYPEVMEFMAKHRG